MGDDVAYVWGGRAKKRVSGVFENKNYYIYSTAVLGYAQLICVLSDVSDPALDPVPGLWPIV